MRFVFLKDKPEVLPLVARWYVDQWGHLKPDRTIEKMQAELHAYLNTASIPLLVLAVAGETVMGAAQLKFREMTIYPEKEHWLGGVYIDADHRGRGAATRLVSHMVTLARELEVGTLYLQTEDLSGGLYARLGWRPFERVHYLGREVLVMENAIGDRKKRAPSWTDAGERRESNMQTEKEKMVAGEMYDASDPQLVAERRRARDLCRELNLSRDGERELRKRILGDLFGRLGEETWIEPPFHCDYGSNIFLGDKVYFNFNCIILDPAPVAIGSRAQFGPAVQIYTATHPLNAAKRSAGPEFAKPIEIGDDVWIGGGAIVCPGVHIGARSVIGAGSVVTGDIPEEVFAAGNPCRVIRSIDS